MTALTENPGHSLDGLEVALRALRGRGFRFIDPRDEHGDVVALVGVRAHNNVLDVVRMHSESHVIASRVPGDSDVLAPATVFWQRTGPARDVLEALLDLPDDRSPGSLSASGDGCR
jgi:hypothetical protein